MTAESDHTEDTVRRATEMTPTGRLRVRAGILQQEWSATTQVWLPVPADDDQPGPSAETVPPPRSADVPAYRVRQETSCVVLEELTTEGPKIVAYFDDPEAAETLMRSLVR